VSAVEGLVVQIRGFPWHEPRGWGRSGIISEWGGERYSKIPMCTRKATVRERSNPMPIMRPTKYP